MECMTWQCLFWEKLPVHILIHIFSFLSRQDQLQAALTCKSWHEVFSSSANWRQYTFSFFTDVDKRHHRCIEAYGRFLRIVEVKIDQYEPSNRKAACKAIESLADMEERRLEKLTIQCLGRNPLFYAGLEFIAALQHLVGPPTNHSRVVNNLMHLDLSGLPVLFDDILFEILAQNHPRLEFLNIQNSPLVCKVTATCIHHLVQRCRRLKELRILNCSLSEEVLNAFSEGDRRPLEHLAITCRREEKYAKDISAQTWKKLSSRFPDLRVTLRFDHTCPLHKIAQILQPEIPCSILRLETFTFIHDEIKQAATYYSKTLESVIVQTRPSRELNDALLMLSDNCAKLVALHVFCIVDKETIDCILERHPTMKSCKTYTLRHEVGPDGIWFSEDKLRK